MSDYTQTTYTLTEPNFDTPIVQTKRKSKLPIFILIGVVVLLVFVLLYLLFSGSPKTNNNNNTIDPNEKVTIQWWGVFLDPEVVEPLIEEYEALHQNVTIEYANKMPLSTRDSANEIYRSEINRVLSENNQVQIPDIFMVHDSWIGDYEDYIKPSTTYDADTYTSAFYDAAGEVFVKDNKVLAVPLWMDTLAVLYNKDMLAAEAVSTPPENWTDFLDLAQILTKESGGDLTQAGFAAGTSENVTYSVELLNLLMLQNGVSIVDEDTKLPIFSTNDYSLDALEFYQSFDNVTWDDDMPIDAAAFLEKKVAMIVASSWRYRDILRYKEYYEVDLDIGVSKIPQISGQTESFIDWADFWGCVVALNRPDTAKLVSWDFLNWLSQPEQLQKLHQNVTAYSTLFGPLYPRKDMSQELETDEFLQVFNESLPYARSWDMIKGIEVRATFQELISSSASTSQIAQIENAILDIMSTKGSLISE